jgi:putative ABC transport system substrate-binding protein
VDSAPFTLNGAPLPFKSEFDAATRAHGFEYRVQVARRLEDVKSVLTEAAASGAEAVMIGGVQYLANVRQVAEFALRRRWITSTFVLDLLDAGLLMYQGPTVAEIVYLISRPVQIADRILRGANPAEIPVELPTRYELALNLKAARKIGVTLPQALVLRADRVIE